MRLHEEGARGRPVPMDRFGCASCGATWQKHPATTVPCPKCGAPVGSPCKRPSGHELYGGVAHVEREREAVDEGLMEMYPEGPTARAKRGDAA